MIAQARILVWRETYRGIYPDAMLDEYDVEKYAEHDRDRIADPAENYYVFLDAGTCVGYFSFGPYHHGTYKDFPVCLNHLYIRRSHQKRGLGRMAFAVLKEYCKQLSYLLTIV